MPDPMEENRQLRATVAEEAAKENIKLRETLMGENGARLIVGALRSAIDAHGPITPEWIGSTDKRIRAALAARAREVAPDPRAALSDSQGGPDAH